MELPLPSLVRRFRERCSGVRKVEEAADKFLEYLNEFGTKAPQSVKVAHMNFLIRPIVNQIMERFRTQIETYIEEYFRENSEVVNKPVRFDMNEMAPKVLDDSLEYFERIMEHSGDAEFVGGGTIRFSGTKQAFIRKIVDSKFPPAASQTQRKRAVDIVKSALKSSFLSPAKTGIVIAGFGDSELFPTLVSYEIDGIVFGKLKYKRTNYVDIDRAGPKARVIPFAQKEMVERFLYGLDEKIQNDIAKFCEQTVPQIRMQIFDMLELPDEKGRSDLESDAQKAETAFISGLRNKAFEKIRSDSRAEIEDMVEFMPKPELATMAEALVNLTSIKRRVSRGMETVGGPIDVAVISQSEGFVWVKRKHYFPAELNSRYFVRVNKRLMDHQEAAHEEPKSRSSGETRQKRTPERTRKTTRRNFTG